MYRVICLTVGLALFSACGPSNSRSEATEPETPIAPERGVPAFAQPIEAAHGADTFRSQPGLRFELALRYGDSLELLTEVVMEPDRSRIRMQKENGSKLIWDGEDAYLAPGNADWSQPRSTVLTWPYFVCMPFLLSDPGTSLEPTGESTLLDSTYSTARLTYATGDNHTPSEWYQLYRDDASGQLRAVAYQVTNFTEAEEEAPHAVTYHNFTAVDGAQFPTELRFWDWNEETGLGKRWGTARLAGFRFMETDKFTFGIPLSHRKIEE
jgi:hypothetical protein